MLVHALLCTMQAVRCRRFGAGGSVQAVRVCVQCSAFLHAPGALLAMSAPHTRAPNVTSALIQP
jgi:hypothetical protein